MRKLARLDAGEGGDHLPTSLSERKLADYQSGRGQITRDAVIREPVDVIIAGGDMRVGKDVRERNGGK